MDPESILREYFWPLVLGALAGFFYLALVSAAILRSRSLVDLCRAVVRLREKHEREKKPGQEATELARLQNFENGLRSILRREGLRPAPAPPAPAPAPAPARATPGRRSA